MTDLRAINHEQRLFVLDAGNGVSCLGFEVERRRSAALAEELRGLGLEVEPLDAQPGTLEAWQEHQEVLDMARKHWQRTGHRFGCELSPQLAKLEGWRVEVVTHYGETRRFIVGKSGGWMPCHLEIARSNAHGGPAAEHSYRSVRAIERVR